VSGHDEAKCFDCHQSVPTPWRSGTHYICLLCLGRRLALMVDRFTSELAAEVEAHRITEEKLQVALKRITKLGNRHE